MNKVKKYREDKKMTQQELACLLGVSLSYIQNVENERNVPTVYNALLIAQILETDINLLFPLEVANVQNDSCKV